MKIYLFTSLSFIFLYSNNTLSQINNPASRTPTTSQNSDYQKMQSYKLCLESTRSANDNGDKEGCRNFIYGRGNPNRSDQKSINKPSNSPLNDYYLDDTPPPPKGTQPSQKQSPSFSQCESAYKKTQVTCNGQTIAPAVTALLNSVAQMKSSGNMKAACESAKKVSA